MLALFPPPLGTRIADRFELQAPLRGDGAVQTFLVHDHQTGRRRALTLFDPTAAPPHVWTEYARIITAAAAARIPGLVLPPHVPPTAPDPPHVLADPPPHRSLDRLYSQEGRLPWQRALTLGERVAAVLQAAHAATGVGHRALTPARITVDPRDEVEILDLGAAEIELTGDPPEDPGYRAPEQRTSKGDHRSDLYALAAILHELIYGACPTGPQPRPAASVVVPPDVDRLLRQSLLHDPALRPTDVSAMRTALRELLGLPALPACPPAASAPPGPTPPNRPTLDPPRATTIPASPAPAIAASPAPRPAPAQPTSPRPLASPRPRPLATLDPPVDRTERIVRIPVLEDTTLILPGSGESPTERLAPPVPAARVQPYDSSPDESHDARTAVFARRPDLRLPPEERTERLSEPEAGPERTEVLSPTPGRGRPPPPERTELLSPTSPRTVDEDRTLVMTRRDDVRAQLPAASSQLDPTLAMAAIRPPRRAPEPAPPLDPSRDSTLQLPPPSTPAPEGTLRSVLLVVNIVLGVTLVVFVVWLVVT